MLIINCTKKIFNIEPLKQSSVSWVEKNNLAFFLIGYLWFVNYNGITIEENRTRHKLLYLIFRSINMLVLLVMIVSFQLLTLLHEYRTKGNAMKVVSTVHPDDINEKFNFLSIVAERNFYREIFHLRSWSLHYFLGFIFTLNNIS